MSATVLEPFYEPGIAEEQLNRLIKLEKNGMASPLVIRTLDKLFALEVEEARSKLALLYADMHEFEAMYGMESTEFYRQYRDGKTDDLMDFVEWASLIQMAENLQGFTN